MWSRMPIFSEKWGDLSWSRIGPKFKLHHLRKVSMTVLTSKSSIVSQPTSFLKIANMLLLNGYLRCSMPVFEKCG